ncbi:hypothetical protein ABFS83_01G001800 [Erythranthe nasuta]
MCLSKDLVLLMLQFCAEENLKRTAHMLEQESGYFFDLEYFEELILHGNWDEAEDYLSSFTLLEDNKYSTKIYFEIRKQKFLEALDKRESAAALDILVKDLKVFEQSNKELYKEMTLLLTMPNFREHSELTSYGDTLSVRRSIINEMRAVIQANPILHGKTNFPPINKSRLRRLINQSLNWQHKHCAHPHPHPHIDTLFTDHKCPGPDNMMQHNQLENEISLVTMSTELSASPLTGTTPAVKPLNEVISPSDYSSICQDSANDFEKDEILAIIEGHELLQTSPCVRGDSSSGYLTESFRKLSVNQMPVLPLQTVVPARNAASEDSLVMWQNTSARGVCPNNELMKMEIPQISKVVDVSSCEYVILPSLVQTNTIRRLVYSHSGNGVVALAEDGTHLLWKWEKNDDNINGEASTKSTPALYQPKRGLLMINDTPPRNSSLDDQVPSTLTLSKNDAYVISSSGAVISLYNAISFKELRSVMRPPPAATCIVFYPPDNNVIAIGRHDASILIFNIRTDELISKLKGHSKRVTGLAFSTTLNVLVSCAVDTEIIVWDSRTWEKKKSTVLQISGGLLGSAELSETSIELDKDHNHFLAVHQTQLAIYETLTLRRVKQWTIANFCARISHATYSCDSEMVYAAMRDGIILVLDASDLSPRYEIDPSAYLPSRLRPCYVVGVVDPVVIAAHPKKKNQFALGLSNGEVVVVEPAFPTQVKLAGLPSSL